MLKLLRINGLLILTLSIAGCSVFGIRTAEELKYDVISKSGDFEIRSYEPYISAVATMKGPYEQVQGDLFRILAAYILTAPVVLEPESEGAWKMSFSMPSEYTMQSLPKPLDPQVSLVEVPAKKFAVIRFSGSFDDLEKRRSKAEELSKWLSTQPQYKKMSEPVFAGYDPPFTLPFLRRNEVMIEIEG